MRHTFLLGAARYDPGFAPSSSNLKVKLATWNVNSLAVRLPQLLDWLAAHPVDALVLQETKSSLTRNSGRLVIAASASGRRPTTASLF
jgi:hypothetical protein